MNGNQLIRRGGRKNSNRRVIRRNINRNGFINQSNKYSDYNLFKKNQEIFQQFFEPGRYAADRLRVRLVYQDPTGSRTTTGSSPSTNWRYQSSAFDPDPLLLTGSIPGFAELANLYQQYCVHGIHANIQVANQDTQAYIIVAWPGNDNINNNSLAPADLAEFSGNVFANSKMVGGASGVNVASLNVSAMAEQLVGSRFKTDFDYSSSVSASPAKLFYLNIGAYSPLGNQAYPLVTKIRLIYDIEFFKLRQLES